MKYIYQNKPFLLFFVLLYLTQHISCGFMEKESPISSSKIENIDPIAFNSLITKKKVQLLDVRTPEEVKSGAIEGSKNIDFYAPNFEKALGELDPQIPVAVYCRSGGRSTQTAQLLIRKGFNITYNLKGGYDQWKLIYPN